MDQMGQEAKSSLAAVEDLRLDTVTQSSQDLIRGTSGFSLDWEQFSEARTKLWSESRVVFCMIRACGAVPLAAN